MVDAGIFDREHPIPPSALLTTGTSVECLRHAGRFATSSDSALRSLAHDLAREDRTLEEQLDQGRLEMWWKGIVDAAKASVRADADRDGDAMAKREQTKQEVAAKLGFGEAKGTKVLRNAHTNGGGVTDALGDTVMA